MSRCTKSWRRAWWIPFLAFGLTTGAGAAPSFNYEAFGGLRNEPGTYTGYNFDTTIEFPLPFEDFTIYPGQTSPYPIAMCWGERPMYPGMQPMDGKSGIGLRYATGQVEADGDSEEFGTIVHFNRPVHPENEDDPVYPENGLDMIVAWNLKLWDETNTAKVLDQPLAFDLYQWETGNLVPAISDCPRATAGDYTANGHTFTSDGNNETACDDAFTFQGQGMGAPQFDYGGETFRVNVLGFFEVDLDLDASPWPTYACTDRVAGGGATPTFWSPETMRNAACVRFNLTRVPALAMYVDIKPLSCPNPIDVGLNPRSGAVLPAAILGTAELDAMLVDPETVRLCLEGNCVSPLRWSYEMAAAPYEGDPCIDRESCTTENDQYVDLTLKFGYNEVLDTLGLRGLAAGEVRCLTLRAHLYDGTVLEGQDVVWINPANQPEDEGASLVKKAKKD